MPHSTSDGRSARVDGEMAPSKTLSHLTSYPVVSDSISTIKSNPYGAKSFDIADAGYSKFVAPTLPYLQRPYSYVSPYVAKADDLGDTALNKIDDKFPVIKTETKDIKDGAISYAHYPFQKYDDGKKYLLDTWNSEYKKCGGDGYVAGVKALITSSLVLVSDSLTWASDVISQKKEQAKEIAREKTQN